jgi:hypothetical protein
MIETRAQATAAETEFVARIDRIRVRVVLKLAEKVREIDATMSLMAGDGGDAVDAFMTSAASARSSASTQPANTRDPAPPF